MFLGIDIGTSAVKAVLVDADGRLVEEASAPLSVARQQPLWSEQSPDDWWTATEAAVESLDPARRRQVRAIGLAGQMHGATLLGADDRPLRPAILWNDGRAEAECDAFEAAAPDSRRIAANRAFAGFTAPKLLWVRGHEPDLFAATETVLLPKDYVRLAMTGDKATDASDASGTLWLDVGARDWSGALLAATGLERRHMPTLYEGTEATGMLRAEVARRWGMDPVPVAAGGGDNAAAAVGAGVVRDGEAFLSLGTSGVSFVATDSLRGAPDSGLHAFCHALPGQWHQMAVMLSAAACLDWAAAIMGIDVAGLVAAAERAAPDATPVFLPYLTGERTPHADANARGAFVGMTASTGQAEIARAVLDGVAMGLRDGLDVIVGAGSRVDRFTVVGGGSRSPFWGRLLASALGRPLDYRDGAAVGPALGAARLAMIAAGGADSASATRPPPLRETIDPDPREAERFAALQPRFRDLYADLHSSRQD
ncbi:xylulokinase [Sphingomonas sp. ASV193]|uniref:xylulokinase n=1 Tax=Sphingomonas sp. ASV193 TaxID=3144405 RepID=UPI0032E90411